MPQTLAGPEGRTVRSLEGHGEPAILWVYSFMLIAPIAFLLIYLLTGMEATGLLIAALVLSPLFVFAGLSVLMAIPLKRLEIGNKELRYYSGGKLGRTIALKKITAIAIRKTPKNVITIDLAVRNDAPLRLINKSDLSNLSMERLIGFLIDEGQADKISTDQCGWKERFEAR